MMKVVADFSFYSKIQRSNLTSFNVQCLAGKLVHLSVLIQKLLFVSLLILIVIWYLFFNSLRLFSVLSLRNTLSITARIFWNAVP